MSDRARSDASGPPIPIHRVCPSIDHEQALAGELRESYFEPGLPVIVRGGMEDWGAIEKWRDTGYLTSALGDTTVTVLCAERRTRGMDDSGEPLETHADRQMPLRDFFRLISDESDDRYYYISEKPILVGDEPDHLGAVAGDIRVPRYLDDLEYFKAVVFAGRNTRCPCHYHTGPEALLCQVRGTKRVLLFDPGREQLRALYAQPWFRLSFRFSRVPFPRDGSMPDLERFPRFARARAVECILEPGDMLYIPLFWWHVAWGRGFNISVSHFWVSPWRRRFLSLRSLRGRVSPKLLQYHWQRLTGRAERGA